MGAALNPPLVVGISGASGALLGIRLLSAVRSLQIPTRLVITTAARQTILQETGRDPDEVAALADIAYHPDEVDAAIASGSFPTRGMVIIPCSIKSLSAIANSYSADLLARAADVTLKEGRPLALVVREAPLHLGHLELMQRAARLGAVIYPPVPTFYNHPQTIEALADDIVGRVLERIGIPNPLLKRWQG